MSSCTPAGEAPSAGAASVPNIGTSALRGSLAAGVTTVGAAAIKGVAAAAAGGGTSVEAAAGDDTTSGSGYSSSTGILCKYPYPIPHPSDPSPPQAPLGVMVTSLQWSVSVL